MEPAGRRSTSCEVIAVPTRPAHQGVAMLLSPMFPTPALGVDVASCARLAWFGFGCLEREQRLNQRALVDWYRGPEPYTWLPRAMQATALLVQAACARELVRWIDHNDAWLPHAAVPAHPHRQPARSAVPAFA
jgi:hypothetical protein